MVTLGEGIDTMTMYFQKRLQLYYGQNIRNNFRRNGSLIHLNLNYHNIHDES